MYPIKSIRGTSPPSLVATYMGFPHDRRFMLLRVAGNQNMHVSQFPEMCLFTTALAPDSHDSLNPTPSTIRVTYTKDHTFDRPDQKVEDKVLEVPIAPDTADLEKVEVIMHSSPTQGYDMGRQYNDWFSERFGYEVKLLCLGENRRKVLGNVPPDVAARQRDVPAATSSTANGGNGWLGSLTSTVTLLLNAVTGAAEDKENKYDGVDEGISFADCAPYLVISTKSWENAQKRLPEGEVMDISKFRPNIIVEGADEAFEEDFWGELQIGTDDSCRVVLTQNCTRCNSLNIDYNTGKVGEGEAGKILKKLQSDRRVDPGAKWSPVFGRYGFLARLPAGQRGVEIKVGDEVKVLKRNQNRTRFGMSNVKPLATADVGKCHHVEPLLTTVYRMAKSQHELREKTTLCYALDTLFFLLSLQ